MERLSDMSCSQELEEENALLAALTSDELQQLQQDLEALEIGSESSSEATHPRVPLQVTERTKTSKEQCNQSWREKGRPLQKIKVDSTVVTNNTELKQERVNLRTRNIDISKSKGCADMNPEEKNKCQRKEVAERNIKEIATERKRVKEDSDEGVASDEDESYNVDHLQVKNEIGLEGDVGDKRAPSTTRTTSNEFEFVPGERQKTGISAVLEALLENIRQNNAELTDVNLNNKENVSTETLVVFAQALCNNTAVSCWSLANTRADDRVALAVAAMLRQNKGLRTLNVESNFIGGRGIIAIVGALRYNDTLIELRIHNQRHILGGRVEMDMARLLRDNSTLLRLGYHFELAGPRMTTASLLSRNLDRQRQQRLEERRRATVLQAKEGSGAVPEPSNSKAVPRNLQKDNRKMIKTPPLTTPPPPPPPAPPPPPPPSLSQSATAAVKKKSNRSVEHSLRPPAFEVKLHPVKERTQGKEKEAGLARPKQSVRGALMASIRSSSLKNLRKVEVPKLLR